MPTMHDPPTKREGPRVLVMSTTSCDGCAYHTSEHYCVEDGNDSDSGFNHFCAHLGTPEKPKPIGDIVPKECPFLAAATADAVRRFNDAAR